MKFTPLVALGAAAAIALSGCGSSDDAADAAKSVADTATEKAAETMADKMDIVKLAMATPDLSTLVAAVTAAGLGDTLSGEGPYTVFAPTNDAFDALGKETLTELTTTDEGKKKLAGILQNHAVSGKVMSSDLKDGQMVETLGGAKLKVSIADGTVKIGNATVVTANVDASNGVVHVIDAVIS